MKLVVQVLSCIRLFATPWSVALQAPLSMGFPRQEYWSGLPFPPPGDLPDPGIEPVFPALADGCFTTESPGKPSENLRRLQIKRREEKSKSPEVPVLAEDRHGWTPLTLRPVRGCGHMRRPAEKAECPQDSVHGEASGGMLGRTVV